MSMDRFKKFVIKPWNSTVMDSEAPISRIVSKHLLQVYSTLSYTLFLSLFGTLGHLYLEMGGWTTAVGFIGSLYWMSKINPWREKPRVFSLMAAAFFFGATMGPVINLFIQMDQRDIIKIIMGGLVFYSCEFGAGLHTLDRNVIHQLREFTTPIFMTAWMIVNNTYPRLLAHCVFLLVQAIPWYIIVFLLEFFMMDRSLKIWFNLLTHLAWILLLCFCFNYPFLYLMYMYILVLGLLWNMRIYTQEAIHVAVHHTEESYFVNTTIIFFTEFIARTVCLVSHIVKILTREIRNRCHLA